MSRVIGGLVAAAIVAAPVSALGSVRQAPDSLPPIPFVLHRNKIVVPVTVDGAGPYDFILDTGSPVTVLTSFRDAADLGLEIVRSVQIGGAGAGPAPRAGLTETAEIALAGVVLGRVPLVVAEVKDDLGAGSGRAYMGVIGKLLFDRYVVRIDFQERVLQLIEPEAYRVPAGADVLPLRFAGGHPHVDATVRLRNGVSTNVDLVVDTGARSGLTLDRAPGRGIVPPPDSVRMLVGRGAQGALRGTVGRISELTLGSFHFPDLITDFVEDELGLTPGADGNLGAELLRRFRTTVDYTNRRLVLEPTADLRAPVPLDQSGITLSARGDGFAELVVGTVRPGSVAEAAGIREGDVIHSVDGRHDWTLEALESRLQRAGPARLELGRHGKRHSLELALAPPIP